MGDGGQRLYNSAALLSQAVLCIVSLVATTNDGLSAWGESRTARRLLLPKEPAMLSYGQGQVQVLENFTSLFFPGYLPTGIILVAGANNVQPSPEECSVSCLELAACNMFSFCSHTGGCVNTSYNLTAAAGACQLVNQELSGPATGRPPVAVEAPGFLGGAPIRFEWPAIDGYEVIPGIGFWYKLDYTCPGSVASSTGCGHNGSPEELAPLCDADPLCRVMSFFPFGRDYVGEPVTLFKGGPGVGQINLSDSNFNQNSVLYIKLAPAPLSPAAPAEVGSGGDSGGSGGLSGGAVAAIVVGACCGVILVAASAILLLKRQRRRTQEHPSEDLAVKAPRSSEEEAEGMGGEQAQDPGSAASRPGPQHPLPPLPRGCPVMPFHSAANERAALASKGQNGSAAQESGLGSPPQSSSVSVSSELRLERLPGDEAWQSSITFCRDGQGNYIELGRGAFASVYRVVLDGVQPFAAKVLHIGDNEEARKLFLQEATMLRALQHRNIVSCAGVCTGANGTGIILMELMEGRDLHSRLHAANKAGERIFGWYLRGKTAALDMAYALHYLHSHSLLHLDVKSKNTLLTRDLTAKLGDMGFSQVMRGTHYSTDGRATGTLDYMAPEILLGRQCTEKADIYSWGVLLWEICTGEYPSRGCLRALEVPSEAPQEVADLFLQCIDEDPAARPSARELVQRLSKLQRVGPPRPEMAPSVSSEVPPASLDGLAGAQPSSL